jgi:hypothetical protein
MGAAMMEVLNWMQSQPRDEEFLEPRPHDNERLLSRLVEVLDRNEVVAAVDRLSHGYSL